MRSPTQRTLTVFDIEDILGEPVTDASELGGGGFATVWRAALADGREVVVKVGPPPTARLLAYEEGLIRREAEYFRLVAGRAPVPEVLAEVTRPALLHFDLWDGNVLVSPTGGLSGLVDGERYLYGDPLLDLVSPALFRRIEDSPDHPFLRGYGRTAFDRAARIRLSLYRLHLSVLMLAEGPSRGIGRDRHDHVTRLLTAELDHLAAL